MGLGRLAIHPENGIFSVLPLPVTQIESSTLESKFVISALKPLFFYSYWGVSLYETPSRKYLSAKISDMNPDPIGTSTLGTGTFVMVSSCNFQNRCQNNKHTCKIHSSIICLHIHPEIFTQIS